MPDAIILQSYIQNIYPTENDVALVPTDGQFGLENNMVAMGNGIGIDGVLPNLTAGVPNGTAGFKITAAAGLNFNMSRGRAIIDGYYLQLIIGAVITLDKNSVLLSVTANSTTIIFLQLNDSSGVIGATDSIIIKTIPFTVSTANLTPPKSIPLAIVVSNASAITAVYDQRFAACSSPLNINPCFHIKLNGGNYLIAPFPSLSLPSFDASLASTFFRKIYAFGKFPVVQGKTQTVILFEYRQWNGAGTFVLLPVQTITIDWVLRSSLGTLTGSSNYSISGSPLSSQLLLKIDVFGGCDMRWDITECFSLEITISGIVFAFTAVHGTLQVLGATTKGWAI